MSKVLKAADEVRKLHRMFQALGDVIEVLDSAGSIDQAQTEAQAGIEKARAAAAEIQAAAEQVRATADRVFADAKASAEAIVTEATAARAAASAWADAALKNAQTAADALMDGAKEQVEVAEKRVSEVNAEVAAKAAELADLEKKLEQVKARAAKLLDA